MARRKLKTKSKAGGAQKKKQKMEIDDQPSSSSPLANFQVEVDNQQPSTSVKIDNGPPESKFKESKSDRENKVEVENNCSIEDLPPEMLMKITQCLDIKSLVNCRIVSRKWNGIAREILKQRDDLEITFECENKRNGRLKISSTNRGTVLSGFVKYFKASKEAPLYTRFRFNGFQTCVFDDPNWIAFVSAIGESIKCLKLLVKERMLIQGLEKMTEELRHLFLNQVPNLQEFGLELPRAYVSRTSLGIQLFPTTAQLQLPHLKIVYLDNSFFSSYTGIATDLLRAAINLQTIELFKWNIFRLDVETVQLVESVGKLHCLKNARIQLASFLYELNKSYTILMSFKLKKLHLYTEDIFRDKNLWLDASVFISHLFESSKNTLTNLTMEPLGFLPQLQLPKFSKLTTLYTFQQFTGQPAQVLPSGFNLNEIFPVLKYLKLVVPWTQFFPNDENVDCLPNLTNLVIDYGEMTAEDVARISQVCPNLKELKLVSGHRQNFPEVGTAIWTHLQQLESLKLDIDVSDPANAFPAIDSCITGLSEEDVIRLHNLIKDEKSTKKQGSQSEVEMDRQQPSILDLKGLKNLTIKLKARPGQTISGSIWTKTLIVSEKYAFKLMDDLDFKIGNWFF